MAGLPGTPLKSHSCPPGPPAGQDTHLALPPEKWLYLLGTGDARGRREEERPEGLLLARGWRTPRGANLTSERSLFS